MSAHALRCFFGLKGRRDAAIFFGLCLVVAACDRAPAGTPTEPETITSDAAGTATEAASNSWATRRSLTPWRKSMAAGTINGIVYVVGGQRRDGVALARVDAYNVATNTWSQVASLPGARVDPNGASMINGKLYVTGGSNGAGNRTRTLFVYDPGTNSWARKADMPRVSCGGDQGVIDGRLYVYTGCYSANSMGNVFFRYNPGTDTWVTRAAPPVDHHRGAGTVVNGRFYLASGFKLVQETPTNSEFEDLNAQLDVYNPATNSWTTRRNVQQKVSGAAAATLDGKLFLAAGVSFENPSDLLQVYDPVTNTWTMKAPLPNRHSDGAASVAGSRLFFVAGVEWLEPPGPSKFYGYTP